MTLGPRALFRILLRAIGVFFVIGGSASLLSSISAWGYDVVAGSNLAWSFWARSVLHSLIEISLGLYCLFRGEWLVRLVSPNSANACEECGYDLRELPGSACPECGAEVQKSAS